MIDSLLQFAIARRWLVIACTLLLAALGAYNYLRLPIDAVPDITNVQVQVNAVATGFTPLEVGATRHRADRSRASPDFHTWSIRDRCRGTACRRSP